MLSKRKRMTALEVAQVLKSGRPLRTPFLGGKALSSTKRGQVAVIVPKSTLKKAVQRNKVRRAAYRALAALVPRLPQAQLVLFVRVVPPAPLEPAFAEDMSALLHKLS